MSACRVADCPREGASRGGGHLCDRHYQTQKRLRARCADAVETLRRARLLTDEEAESLDEAARTLWVEEARA